MVVVNHLSHRYIVHQEQDVMGIPKEGIVMERVGGVKPKIELFFAAAAAAVDVKIGLQNPISPLVVPKQFYVYFVMVVWVHPFIRHIKGHNNSRCESCWELYSSIEESIVMPLF